MSRLDPGGSGTLLDIWGGGGTRCWRISVAAAPLHYEVGVSFNGSSESSESSPTTILLDVFNHIGMAYDGTNLDFYLNGVLDVTGVNAGVLNVSALDWALGGQSSSAAELDVDMEDARFYNRLLSAAEWLTIFNTQGKDGIVQGLQARLPIVDQIPGVLVTAKNPLDVGPNNFALANAFGSPVAQYNAGTGFGFR